MNRNIEIEFNKFSKVPQASLMDSKTNDYVDSLDIDLNKLSAIYKIEEFDDYSATLCYSEYPALRYLIPNTDRFKFKGGHPGKGKDSRRENSRVLGQSLCRYFNSQFLDAPYIANVSDFLEKQLGAEYHNVMIKRKSKGDTPDFLSARNDKSIFLSEAKGRRSIIPFTDSDFNKWRKQFDRISVLCNKKELSLKGYIFEVAIANEKNKISNSRILVEDPNTSGEPFVTNDDLFNLTRNGHYKRVLQKMGFQFIGDSLIYAEKLTKQEFSFQIFTSKKTKKEYIGIFIPNWPFEFYFPFLQFSEYNHIVKRHTQFFFGVEKSIFKSLIGIARGNEELLQNFENSNTGNFSDASHFEFEDGTLLSSPYLISIGKYEQF